MDDYISRAALEAAVMTAKWKDGYDGAMAMEIVAGASAADVEPVVHARWVTARNQYGQNRLICSACGEHSGLLRKKPRCPHCGAKMDEKEDKDHA